MSFVSVLEAFSIGIGPSSSHTMGPMRASRRFLVQLKERELLEDVDSVKIELYGSLAMTGKGHATDIAILLGLEGESPEGVDPNAVPHRIAAIQRAQELFLFGRYPISFNPGSDILFLRGKRLPFHSNAMKYRAFHKSGQEIHMQIFYSIGGGFVLDHQEAMQNPADTFDRIVPFPFKTAEELLAHSTKEQKAIWEIVLENEKAHQSEEMLYQGIDRIWNTMSQCVERGIQTKGILPGGLEVQRRAPGLFEALMHSTVSFAEDPTLVMEWVSLYSLAVNEENAAGGRVVTAPTNGSAGVIPAVLFYACKFVRHFNDQSRIVFFLTATALLILYKENASISAAEMGCQGEIGVSSSMAAAALCAVLGGTSAQIANAAEIAMEHHLGLTCDPVFGLVQIPCIERNSMGAIKAINAARLALRGNGKHRVSLDAVIRAMKETGKNMKEMYKETSEGGLAIQITQAQTVC
ncbi:MAG: L-serine ammonia-lyase [Chlamydiae bacterium RIFCSPHIGHO2_12_FULL_44_59]|nr:MAG: L-serine ammonia-lyase [Chlamydiae bacterium RIFCSPHIGHO2_01_FULL_44_39]OGN58713.1 MAG: L-serine ammonia-lyase [Chlamydiae bacterium RIFCSPHIGHO2_02_FULL_45_9]OGN59891.1 MAG: L-serine ammonia-lyase [Chlamydiae bacterium RIFCSPHIGHO2_12_FULL_44_59]OGN66098.1 MAG: L-serine ammonia-lyase [Chlamydiae bacterium RIFCSPLOWO2_01_FULL_44_52]OGN68633.1 MAG: L-serine ammonia-lyase [Chlamydiae bacterium RIFCSPLOWO2_02_FULL_45_22]OGN69746.1 MAG: L-serine ammonia-lyase [Chlamydiae bacterium RIFCSPLO